MFLGSTWVPVPSSRPVERRTGARNGGQKRRVLHAAGAEPRAGRLSGEHGEHPPFDRNEHTGILAKKGALHPSSCHQFMTSLIAHRYVTTCFFEKGRAWRYPMRS